MRFYYINNKGKKQFHNRSSKYCKRCEVKRPIVHHCFIPCVKKSQSFYSKNPNEKCEVYVYDFKTEANPKNLGIFRPYFVAVYKFCNVCMDDYSTKLEYQCCGMNDWTYFEDENTDVNFGQFFLSIADKGYKSRWFAHNGLRFDSLFLLRYLVCEKKLIPKVIMNGLKILKLTYKNAEVLDSMLLCPSSLKKVVEMLDLGNHIKKGYLPYELTDFNYMGPIPEKEQFGISKMNEKVSKTFNDWYDVKKSSNYVLKNEVKECCKNDVFILLKALLKFHKIILEFTKIEVLFDFGVMTISSLALKVFMNMNDYKDMMGVEPIVGYNGGKTLKNQMVK